MGSCCSNEEEWTGYDDQLLKDKKEQTIWIPNSEEKGASPIIRCPQAKDAFQMFLTDPESKVEINSGWMCAKSAMERYPSRNCFGYRPYEYVEPQSDVNQPILSSTIQRGTYKFDTYDTICKQVYAVGNGLASLGLEPQSNIGIFSINRSEWMVSHLGNWSQSYRTVALYDTLGAAAVQYILWHSELSAIYVEKDKLPQLFEAISSCDTQQKQAMKLRFIIQFDYQSRYNNKHETISDADVATAKSLGTTLIGFTSVISSGGDQTACVEPKPSDLAYIMYTSGTTGDPKGVMLSHQVFACTVASALRKLKEFGIPITKEDVHCSYLPLAHSFEAAIITSCVSAGAAVAFWAGNIKQIARDWQELRPTLMFGVPRIYTKTYDKVRLQVKASGAVKQWVFDNAETTSQSLIRKQQRSAMYDNLVWSKVCEQMGFDRVRILASGAAPLPPHIAEFLKIACADAIVVQGYGLTETCAISFFTSFDDDNLGHVGAPIDNIEFRLVDAPECDYYVTDEPYARGEVQLRGPTVMSGYFKNEEATTKALDKDGWFSTGDIGRINPNGTLSIIDRRKNMFKTAMGEYIAAEKVESVYSKSAASNQIWIYGNSFKSFIVAVVVPDALWLVPILMEKGIWTDEKIKPATKEYCDKFVSICTEHYDVVKEIVVSDMKAVEAQSDLKKFERIKDYYIESNLDELLQGFHVKNNTLTPTFKKKRPQLLAKYVDIIKQLYEKNGEAPQDHERW